VRDGKSVDCQQSCQSFAASLPTPVHAEKKQNTNAGTANATNADAVYQPAVAEDAVVGVVVAASLCASVIMSKMDEAKKILCSAFVKHGGINDFETMRSWRVATSILRDDGSNNDNNVQETMDLLKELPESIRSRKAVTASLASIYHAQGKEQEAEQLLRDTGDDQALAEFAMSQGNYASAAALYEKAATDTQDAVATARWVYALSFVDPERAQKVWKEVSPDLVDEQDPTRTRLNGETSAALKISKHERRILSQSTRGRQRPRKVLRRCCEGVRKHEKHICWDYSKWDFTEWTARRSRTLNAGFPSSNDLMHEEDGIEVDRIRAHRVVCPRKTPRNSM
jgi:hypothetical protein